MDVLPAQMYPTWENGRSDKAYVAKRLDRFILHVSLIDKMGMPFSSIEKVFISDHRLKVLGWKNKGFRKGYSFKFNRTFLEDPAFSDLIKNLWCERLPFNPHFIFMTFRDKMDFVRKEVKESQFKKRQSNRLDLRKIQKELDYVSDAMASNNIYFQKRCHIKELQRKNAKNYRTRGNILEAEE